MKKTILVVDDENLIRDLITLRLDYLGALFFQAGSGYEAISKIEEMKSIDLVIIDYVMKNGDGVSLAHYCHNHNIPYILVSGYEPRDIVSYAPLGSAIVEKITITDDSFCSLVNRMLKV